MLEKLAELMLIEHEEGFPLVAEWVAWEILVWLLELVEQEADFGTLEVSAVEFLVDWDTGWEFAFCALVVTLLEEYQSS